jgi:hypothetical protein
MTKALLYPLGQSLSYGRLSLLAKVLWPMLLSTSDDQGRGTAEPDAVKWYVCPNVPEITIDNVPALLQELEDQRMILLYNCDRAGLAYQILRWWEYQSLRWARPSKYPAPTNWTDRIRYSDRGNITEKNWDKEGGLPSDTDADNYIENYAENCSDNQPNLTQLNLTKERHGDETSPPESESERKRLVKDEIRGDLEKHFSEKTGLPRPRINTAKQRRAAGELWWKPLREIAELCEWDGDLAKRLIDATLAHLSGQVTIATPKSILKTATAIYTGNAPGAPKFTQAKPEPKMDLIEDPDNPGKYIAVEVIA